MGTTAAKLQAALDSKEAIRQAIIAKEVEVSSETPLSQYPAKIAAIEGGGGAPPQGETFIYVDQYGNEVYRETVAIGDVPSPPPGPPLEHCAFRYWQNLPAVAEWRGETYVTPIYDSENGDTFITLLVDIPYVGITLSKEVGTLTIDKGDGTSVSRNGAIVRGTVSTLIYATPGIYTMRIHSEVPYTLGGSTYNGFITNAGNDYNYGHNITSIIVGSNCVITVGFLRFTKSLQKLVFTHGSNQDSNVTSSSTSPFYHIKTDVISFPNSFTEGAYLGINSGTARIVTYPANYANASSPISGLSGVIYHSMHKTLSGKTWVVSGEDCGVKEIRWVPGGTIMPGRCLYLCHTIGRVRVPEGIISLEIYALYQLRATSLVLPSTVTTIAASCWSGMQTPIIVIKAAVPPTLGSSNTFFQTEYGTPHIFVPDASLAAYAAATNWSAFASYFRPLSTIANYVDIDENGDPR